MGWWRFDRWLADLNDTGNAETARFPNRKLNGFLFLQTHLRTFRLLVFNRGEGGWKKRLFVEILRPTIVNRCSRNAFVPNPLPPVISGGERLSAIVYASHATVKNRTDPMVRTEILDF